MPKNEIKEQAAKLRQAGMSVRHIATHLGKSKSTIARWSKSSDGKTVTIDGVPITSKTPEIAAINQVLKQLPPAGGQWTLPAVQQYAGLIQSVSKFYKNPDQAIINSPTNARAMFNNLTIREPLQARMLAVAELPWEISPENKKDRRQVAVAESIKATIEAIPDFLKYRYSLLYAIWFGKWAVQQRMMWDYRTGRRKLVVRDWTPVHGDTLVPKWDTNEWGIYTGLYNGWDGTKEVTTEPGFLSRAHVLTDEKPTKLSLSERQAFVIHTHDYMPGDFLDPQASGGIKGLGIRSTIYWTWYIQNEIAGWLVEFLERVGTGITIWRYIRGNAESEAAVRQIAESQSNQAAVLFPVDQAVGHNLEDVQRIEPSPVGIQNMMEVLDSYYGTQIRRYIVGQDGTSMPVTSGMNSGVSEAHENTFNRIVRYDALNLADTLTRDLVDVIQQWDYPGSDFRCRFLINVDRPDPKETLEGVFKAYSMGVTFDQDEVRALTGLSKPDEDAVVVGQAQAQPGEEAQAEEEVPDEITTEMPDGGQPEGQADAPITNELRSTVGGLQAIAALQQSFYEGKLPREAAINNVVLLFGFAPDEAESLFPMTAPKKLTEDEGQGGMMPPGQEEQPQPEEEAPQPFHFQFDADWEEGKHPRKGGKFAPKGQGDSGNAKDKNSPKNKPAPKDTPKGKAAPKASTPKEAPKGKEAPKATAPKETPKAAPKNVGSVDTTMHPKAQEKMREIGHALKAAKHLSPAQRKEYFDSAQNVLRNMSEKAVERFSKNVTEPPHFAKDTDGVKQELLRQNAHKPAVVDKLKSAGEVGGAYTHGQGKASFVLDGGHTSAKEKNRSRTAQAVYAHEFTHAIDGPGYEISGSKEWEEAFASELGKGRLTKYASTKRSEGFAEFGRVVLSGEFDQAKIKKNFPKCFSVWEKHGLVPQGKAKHARYAEGGSFDELFGQRVELEDGSHADCLLGGPTSKMRKRFDADWDEGKHPRKGGKFAPKGGGDSGPKDKPEADDKKADGPKDAPTSEDKAEAKSIGQKALAAGEKGWQAVKGAAALGGKVEHAVAHFLSDGVDEKIKHLAETHPKLAKAAAGTWWMAKVGTKVAFASYIAGQQLAEETAKQRGATPEQAAKIRKICTAIDGVGAKAVPTTLSALGIPGGLAASFVPVGSAAYLAYSTARNPVATLKAASSLVKGIFSKKDKVKERYSESDTVAELNRYLDASDRYGDWYDALVYAALSEPDCESFAQALDAADEIIKENPQGPGDDEA